MKTIVDIVLEKQIKTEKEIKRIREKTEKQNNAIIYLIITTIINLGTTLYILWR